MDANINSARFRTLAGEPSADALFRAEAATRTAEPVRNEKNVDGLARREARILRARNDVTMGGYTRFV